MTNDPTADRFTRLLKLIRYAIVIVRLTRRLFGPLKRGG